MLIDMIDASEAREDDENFKNAVDLLFEELEADKPNHFAVRQYKKYKLAAGVISLKRLLNHHFLRNWSSKMIKKSLEAYFLPKYKIVLF
jgi:type IV secretion system protein VirD4